MNRFLRFLLISILNILVWFLAMLFRLLLLPLLALVLRVFRDLVLLSFSATVYGPARFIDRRAGEWTQMIVDLVDDRGHINEIYQLCRFMVASLLLLGWVVSILFTVTMIRVIYGWLFI